MDRLLLHPRDDMAIDVQRHADRRVAEALLDDLGVNALLEQEGGVGMAQVVEPDARQALWQGILRHALLSQLLAEAIECQDASEVALDDVVRMERLPV